MVLARRITCFLAVGLIPATFQIVFLFLVPESPKYTLCFRENREGAYKDLAYLRGGNDASDIDAELDALQAEMDKVGLYLRLTLHEAQLRAASESAWAASSSEVCAGAPSSPASSWLVSSFRG